MDFQQVWDLIGERTQEIWTFISKHITELFRDVLWYLNQFLFLIKNFPRFRRKPKDNILTWKGQTTFDMERTASPLGKTARIKALISITDFEGNEGI